MIWEFDLGGDESSSGWSVDFEHQNLQPIETPSTWNSTVSSYGPWSINWDREIDHEATMELETKNNIWHLQQEAEARGRWDPALIYCPDMIQHRWNPNHPWHTLFMGAYMVKMNEENE